MSICSLNNLNSFINALLFISDYTSLNSINNLNSFINVFLFIPDYTIHPHTQVY